MLPAEEFTMLEGTDHSGRWSDYVFVAEVVATDEDYVVFLPWMWLASGVTEAVIDFGDGTSYTLTGNQSAVWDDEAGRYTNIFVHEYSPGTYYLKITGLGRISWMSQVDFLAWRVVYAGCIRSVLKASIPLASHISYNGWNLGDFEGLDHCDSVIIDYRTQTGAIMLCNMKKLVHYGFYEQRVNWMARDTYGFSGEVEELYLPNMRFTMTVTRAFNFCHSLKLLYIPLCTDLNGRFASAVPEKIDIYTGKLTIIGSNAFRGGGYRADGNNYHPHGDSSIPIPDDGATVHLHVPMTADEFRALSGWTWPSYNSETHPWGAKYLRVYATNLIFDSKGFNFDIENGHRTDENGVWIDDDLRWIDHDGNYVMPDGVTPAVWDDNGGYYEADLSGRRVDGKGHFLDFMGNIVSDCGRRVNSDGDFITALKDDVSRRAPEAPLAIVDFYGRTLIERTAFPAGWYAAHPEYSGLSGDDGRGDPKWYFEKQELVRGELRTVWVAYNGWGYRAFRYVVNPPDGRLVSARVFNGSYLMLGVVPTGTMQVRAVGALVDYSGWAVEDLAEHYYDYNIVGSISISGPERTFRLAPGTVYDAGLDRYVGVWMAQTAESYVTLRMPEGDNAFDLTFGNLSLSDGESTETGTTAEEPSEGWAPLGIGRPSYGPEFDLSLIEISDVVSGDRVVTHRFVSYIKDGVAGFKDLISGTFIAPASGTFRPGEYYTT